MAAFIVAVAALPVNAIEERVRECACNSGFGFRMADADDFVWADRASRQIIVEENRNHAASHVDENVDWTCKSGFVWRDAFNGDGVCVTPASRSRVHAENRRHRDQNTRFEVQDPHSHCHLQ